MNNLNTGGKVVGGLMLLGASVLSGVLTYGTYWHLTSKKKWSGWKAGAAIGAVSGGIALAMAFAGMYPGMGRLGQLPSSRRMTTGYRRAAAARARGGGIPSQFSALVLERVSGCSACG
jgi:hypothetical protein